MNKQILALACTQVSTLINNALRYDPGTVNGLASLRGKILRIESTFPPLTLDIACGESGVELSGAREQVAHVTLHGSALALAMLAADSADSTTFAGTGVVVEGDHDVLRSVRQLARELDIDWEAALAELIGDVPAHLVGQAVRKTQGWSRDAAGRATTGFAHYVKHEAHLTPTPAEASELFAQIRRLADDTERLVARVTVLHPHFDKPAADSL